MDEDEIEEIKSGTKNLPMLYRTAHFLTKSVNVEERTVEMVFTTETPVMRGGFFMEPFNEVLGMKEGEINFERFETGRAPLLDSHDNSTVRNQFGRIIESGAKGKKLVGKVKFSKRPDVEPIFQDVKEGMISNVSIGYRVHEFKDVSKEGDEVKTLRAVNWTPFEASLVSVGADFKATTKSGEIKSNICKIVLKSEDDPENNSQSEKNDDNIENENEIKINQGAITVDEKEKEELAKREAELKAAKDEAAKQAQTRVLDIQEAVKVANLKPEFANDLVKSEFTIDECRAKIFVEMSRVHKPVPYQGVIEHDGGEKEKALLLEGIENALSHRVNAKEGERKYGTELTENGRRFRGFAYSEMCRAFLSRTGVDVTFMKKVDILKRVLATGDFSSLLANVQNKTLRDQYNEMPRTWEPIVDEVENDDFKQMARNQLSAAASLNRKLEGAPIEGSDVSDAKEVYSILTYARKIPFTREAMINDDLQAFSRIPRLMAQAGARKLSDLVWEQITSNPTMGDGTALFAAGHSNLGTVGAISLTTVSELVKLLGLQVGLQSEHLNLVPKNFITGPTLELLARQFNSVNLLAEVATNINPWAGMFNMIIEPRIETGTGGSTDDFYLTGDKSQTDIIEVAYLPGQRSPTVDSFESKDTLDLTFSVVFDVGTKIIDFRNVTKNAGA